MSLSYNLLLTLTNLLHLLSILHLLVKTSVSTLEDTFHSSLTSLNPFLYTVCSSPCFPSFARATGEIILWVGIPSPTPPRGFNPAMGIVNFDNLVMKVGMKALAFANKRRTHYSVKRKQKGGEEGWSSRPANNSIRNSHSGYVTFK